MRFQSTELPGVVVIEPDVHQDARGYFLETYHSAKYAAAGIDGPFVQDNHSRSVHGTLRGLHMQREHPQGKLVRVIQGEVWDVAVDLRVASRTFGRWVGVTLSADNFRQLFIAPGCAHGFCVLSETAQVEYKCTELYHPASEVVIAYDDPELAIPWPTREPILSVRDQHGLSLREFTSRFRYRRRVMERPVRAMAAVG